MRDVGVTLVSVLALLTLVLADPLPQGLDEAESKRGWSSFDGGYGKRGWNAFDGGYGKRSGEDFGEDSPINGEDKRGWNSFQDGYGKRAWNSAFAGGMGKRAWNSQFAGGMGKRAWNSAFAGGMGKRAWNSGFSGGLGKRVPYQDGNTVEMGTNRSIEDEQILDKRSWSDGTMRGAFGKRSWSDGTMRGAFGKRSWSNGAMRGAFGKRSWSNGAMRGAFGKRAWKDIGAGWGRKKRSNDDTDEDDCERLKHFIINEHMLQRLKDCQSLKRLFLNEHIKRSPSQSAYFISQMIQGTNGKKRNRTNNWTQLRGMWGKRSGPQTYNKETVQNVTKREPQDVTHLESPERVLLMGQDVLQ